MRNSNLKSFIMLLICILSIYISLPTFYNNIYSSLTPALRPVPINLGLDLKGGSSTVLEVVLDESVNEYMQQTLDLVLSDFRKSNIRYLNPTITTKGFQFFITSANDQKNAAIKLIYNLLHGKCYITEENDKISVEINNDAIDNIKSSLVKQSIEIIRRRIDETGTKEIDLQPQGSHHILLQVPGSNDTDEIKRLIGQTAKLVLHVVADMKFEDLLKHPSRTSFKVVELENKKKVIVQQKPLITGDMLTDAQVSFSQERPVVAFKLNSIGARIFGEFSAKNLGKAVAIILDGKILSIPVIREPILGGDGVISGNFSVASANELALLLRAGALPAPLKIVEERVVGPSLGIESINAGAKSMIIGISMVTIFMIIFYGSFGIIANLALVINTFMIIAILSIIGATLTLPGIAGIILTLGMAVDANVLICERIREELRNGKKTISAIESGYKIAFSTIVDANITTIIAALILYVIGSGSVKSFAVSLSIGIISSMFTSVSLTKAITAFCYNKLKLRFNI